MNSVGGQAVRAEEQGLSMPIRLAGGIVAPGLVRVAALGGPLVDSPAGVDEVLVLVDVPGQDDAVLRELAALDCPGGALAGDGCRFVAIDAIVPADAVRVRRVEEYPAGAEVIRLPVSAADLFPIADDNPNVAQAFLEFAEPGEQVAVKRFAKAAHARNIPCFCADLTVNPILVDWNKTVASRLAPLPGLRTGIMETNGHQIYRNWETMQSYHPCPGAPWTRMARGFFETGADFFAVSGGIFRPSPHYHELLRLT